MDIVSVSAGAALAALVQVSRTRVAAFHDAYIAVQKPPGGLQFKMLAQFAHDPTADREVFALLFSQAEQRGWLADYVPAAILAGVFQAPVGAELAPQAKLTLQSYTHVEDGFGEPELLGPGVRPPGRASAAWNSMCRAVAGL